MNDPFANSGFLILSGSTPFDLSNDPVDLSVPPKTPIQGFTPVGGSAVLTAITFPTQRGGTQYRGDAASLVGLTLMEGVFYPIPAVGLTLASGTLIGWRD
jgi:hypothetical protein